jgi:hypothetical protein
MATQREEEAVTWGESPTVEVAAGTALLPWTGKAVIVEGWAAVVVRGEPVAAIGPGDVVGLPASFSGRRDDASVVAKTRLRLGPVVDHTTG